MRTPGAGAAILIFGSFLSLSGPFTPQFAQASPTREAGPWVQPSVQPGQAAAKRSLPAGVNAKATLKGRNLARGGGISCVPFARNDSGIAVTGNAWQWWENAAGSYARGSLPEPGSVLAFRSNGRMRLGHVAVVSRVVNPREVTIEHANWSRTGVRGAIARNIPVVDVSEANDWTAVRVGLDRTGQFGSVYPTHGFIYDRPDTGTMIAAAGTPAPHAATLNPPPSDLRPAAERGWQMYEEVAQSPTTPNRQRRVLVQVPNGTQPAATAMDRRQ
jgi:surface antigen